MISPIAVGAEVASQIAAFTRVACPFDLLTTGSIERCVFNDHDPSVTLAVYDGGLEAVASAVVRGDRGFVKFLAVHPRARLRRVGTQLLEHIERFCRDNGAASMEIGSSVPFYLVPGVDVRLTETLCFFESRGYRRRGDAVNQSVRLAGLPEPGLPTHTATRDDHAHMLPWVTEHHPHWVPELQRAVDLGTCVVHASPSDARSILGFACYDVNREGWFGPMATRPGDGVRGVGSATLISALHRMRAHGHEHAEIAWSGPLLFYLKAVNARISRVFWCYGKQL